MAQRRWGACRPASSSLRALLGGVLLLLGVACTGGDGAPDGAERSGRSLPVALEITLASGRLLGEDRRSEVEKAVGDLLSAYVVDAFLGDYPRDDFVRTLPSFTTGGAVHAARDLDLLTGARFADAQAVRATSLTAEVAPLQVGKTVVGATAHVAFEFEVTQEARDVQRFALRGRLMLLRERGHWLIFGYDVTRDDPLGARS